MEARVEMIKAGFRIRYKRAYFVENGKNDELIRILIQKNNTENILRLCIAGQQPLLAVIDEIEEYAKNNMEKILKENNDFDTWKQNVGMLIGTIAYFIGYVSDEEKTLQNTPVYFMNASNFRKG